MSKGAEEEYSARCRIKGGLFEYERRKKLKNTAIKLTAMIALLVFFAFIATGCAQTQTAATVNGEKITKQEVDQQLEKAYGKQVLEFLITKALIRQKAAKEGIQIQPKDIDDRFEMLKTIDPTIEMKLKFGNMSVDDFKKELDVPLYLERIILKSASDKDKKDTYEKLKAQYALLKASWILTNTESQAKEILDQLNKGGDFAKLAEKSIDPETNTKGGDLGMMTSQTMSFKLPPEVAKELLILAPGKISKIIKTPRGYAVVKLEEKKDSYEDLQNFVGFYYSQTKAPELLKKLKDEATITYVMFQEKQEKGKDEKKPEEKGTKNS